MTHPVRLTLAAAVAVLLASTALTPVFADSAWLLRSCLAVLVVASAGLASHAARLPESLRPLVALTALAGYLVVAFTPGTLSFGMIPTGATVDALRTLVRSGLQDVERLATPVPTRPGLVLLAVAGVGVIALFVDTLAVVLGRTAAAGLPLLALFAVCTGVLVDGVGWLPFTLGAVGWLGLLLTEGRARISRWGQPLRAPSDSTSYDVAGLGQVGRRIGAAAVGVAVLVPALAPTMTNRLLADGSGGGTGGSRGNRATTINPITSLSGDLNLPKPQPVLSYISNDDEPDYLRLTTLDLYNGRGWSASKLVEDPDAQDVNRRIPAPARPVTTATRKVRLEVTLQGLNARWLPVPARPDRVDVDDRWLWSQSSETVFSAQTTTRRVEDYVVEATRVLPTPGQLDDAGALPAEIQPYAERPRVTPYVEQQTKAAVAGATSDYDKAVALQAYFTDNRFVYDTRVKPGSAPDLLENFLRTKSGFCEQYASAMAAMLRFAGVPSRVAVGYTAGSQTENGYQVMTSDAHAWPEAWFAGAGWVRFEPTPEGQGRNAPTYSDPDEADAATPSSEPSAAATPSAGPDAGETGDQLDRTVEDEQELLAGGEEGGTTPGRRPVLVALGTTAALVAPALLHLVRRRRRWAEPGPLVAWAQVQDDAVDVGYVWAPADSPRAAAKRLIAARRLTGDAEAAVLRLAGAAERSRYAPPRAAGGMQAQDAVPFARDSAVVRTALRQSTALPQRLRAVLIAPSTMSWLSRTVGDAWADGREAVTSYGLVARRRLRRVVRPT